MLSISNVGGGMLQSYYQKDNYYQKGDPLENNQSWQGKLTEHYEVSGEIDQKDFFRIYDEKKERAAFDLTFSAPKSVSIAMTIKDFSEDMHQAHDEAVSYVLDEIERNNIGYRKKRNGISTYHYSDNMIVSKIKHDLTREADMHLHTHCLILNQTKCSDGKFRALDNRNLYVNRVLRGQQYQNRLAKNLMEKGYEIEITNSEKGEWRLKGFTDEMTDAFSKRSRQKKEYAMLHGFDIHNPKEMAKVVLLTRRAKSKINLETYKDDWEFQKKELGITSKILKRSKESTVKFVHEEDFITQVSFDSGIEKIGFREKDYLLRGLRYGIENGYDVKDIKKLLDKEIKDGYILSTTKREYSKANKNFINRNYYATRDSVELEQDIFKTIREGKGAKNGIELYDTEVFLLDRKQEGLKLTDDQKNAIIYCSTSNDKYSLVNGVAGSGKTTMVKALSKLYEKHGYEIRGMGFTGQATKELSDVGIQSKTIHSFFIEMAKEAGTFKGDPLEVFQYDFGKLKSLKGNEVWFVDESSFINNEIFERFLEVAEKKKAKVHFFGDVQQLPGIGAGNSFANMINDDIIDHINMKENIRQMNADEEIREGIKLTYKKDIKAALNSLNGHISEYSDRKYRIGKIARDFGSMKPSEVSNSFIFTGQNSDRVKINDEVRKVLKEDFKILNGNMFEVMNSKKEKKNIELAINDRIIFLKNDKNLGVLNGTRGSVISTAVGKIIVKSDNDEVIIVDPEKYNYIDYAYCTTVHKAQGATGDHKAFVHIDTSQSSVNSLELWTVAITRSKSLLSIYTDDKEALHDVVSRSGLQLSSSVFADQLNRKQKVKYDKKLADMLLNLKKKILAYTVLPARDRLAWDRYMNKEKEIKRTPAKVKGPNVINYDQWVDVMEKAEAGMAVKKTNRDYPGKIVFTNEEFHHHINYKSSFTKIEGARCRIGDVTGEAYRVGENKIEFTPDNYKDVTGDKNRMMNNILEKVEESIKYDRGYNTSNWNEYQKEWISKALEDKGIEFKFDGNSIGGPEFKGPDRGMGFGM